MTTKRPAAEIARELAEVAKRLAEVDAKIANPRAGEYSYDRADNLDTRDVLAYNHRILRAELEAATPVTPEGPKAASGTTRLTLSIDGATYHLRRITTDPEAARIAWRVRKLDGTVYYVADTPEGRTCECPDFVFRRDGIDPEGCKHIKALAACGLMD